MSEQSTQVPRILEHLEYGPAPEAAGEVRAWVARRTPFGHFIGGAWTAPGPDLLDVAEPARGQSLARATQGTSDDVDRAVDAARAAFPAWAALDGHARARFLYALARQIQKQARFFTVIESLDNGKPIRESRDIDIPLVARHFYHHAGWAQLMAADPELRGYRPLGVAGQIIPWNFPLLMLAWKVAPALATGNTVVLKPAEHTPLTALRFAELCERVGLPPGVVNIVTGDGATGAALVVHPGVDKIAFTGSTEVGRQIRTATAGSGKHLSLELGGKSPFLVYEDADLDSVVEGVVDAIWFNQGQVCCAGSRILAQEGIAGRLVQKLRARMETLRAGDPLDKGTDIGAIVAPVQLERIQRLVEEGRAEGATIWQPSWACPEDGWFYPPTVITDTSPAATVAQVEIFGPVVVLMTFRTPAESVELANNSPYGLAASVWTENINLALDVAPRLKAGTVWVNSTNLFDAASGFGGYRESGFGREGGREGLFEYLEPAWRQGADAAPALEAPDTRNPAGADAGGDAREPTPDVPGAVDAANGAGAAGPAGTPGPAVDRTPKLYVGGRQVRPDAGYVMEVRGPGGRLLGEVGRGNRKDVRDGVEAARRAQAGWARLSGHARAQVVYYLAENLAARAGDFASLVEAGTAAGGAAAAAEVEAAVSRLFAWAGWADKWDGAVHHTPVRNVTIAMPEPLGVVGLACPTAPPLLGLVSTLGPLVATGNTVVLVPGDAPLVATEFYQLLDTSDVPGGVVNIITGVADDLVETLAGHYDVDGLWYFRPGAGGAAVERLSAGNMKRTWVDAVARDWFDPEQGEGPEFLRRATQVKNIWVPYGE